MDPSPATAAPAFALYDAAPDSTATEHLAETLAVDGIAVVVTYAVEVATGTVCGWELAAAVADLPPRAAAAVRTAVSDRALEIEAGWAAGRTAAAEPREQH